MSREPAKQSKSGVVSKRSNIRQSTHRPMLKTSTGASREAVRQSPARKLGGN
jgi:hypothetical protein